MCCKRIIVLNSKSYNFKYHKNTLYGLNIHPPVRISKHRHTRPGNSRGVGGLLLCSKPGNFREEEGELV